MDSVRLASPSDSDSIVAILRNGIGTDRIDYTIYSAHGMPAFVRSQIAAQDAAPNQYFVYVHNSAVIGFAEFRILQTELFLNNIYVRSGAAGHGCGTAMLRAGLALGFEYGLTTIVLDVFLDNQRAMSWYERLGFEKKTASVWLDIDARIRGSRGRCQIANIPFAKCVHEQFGFSLLDIQTPTGSYAVGFLGECFIRITDPHVLADDEALMGLAAFAPSRRLLYIGSPIELKSTAFSSYHEVASSVRLSADLKMVLARVDHDTQENDTT